MIFGSDLVGDDICSIDWELVDDIESCLVCDSYVAVVFVRHNDIDDVL